MPLLAQSIEVDRKIGAGGTYTALPLLPGNTTSFTDTDLIAGTQYFYKIRAIDPQEAAFTAEKSATPPRPTIAGRAIFYNGSEFDEESDEFAIAADKQVSLPGQTATFANYTSYSKGVNGIMVDLTNFDGIASKDDFTFRIGNTSDTSNWQTAPDPAFVITFPGGGAGGSTRVELIWNDGEITNQWLQVTIKADAVTQLALPTFSTSATPSATPATPRRMPMSIPATCSHGPSDDRSRRGEQRVGFQPRSHRRCN